MWEYANASPDVTQQLAALVAVVAVAIIGVAILLVSPTWKGVCDTSAFLKVSEKRSTIRSVASSIAPFVILFFITDFFGVYIPALALTAARAFTFIFLAILIIYLIISQIVQWIRKTKSSSEIEPLLFLYTFTLSWEVLCILFCLIALFGVSNTMLNIEIGPFNRDNYNWARWFIVDGVFFFIMSVVSFGYTLICQKIRVRKQSDNEEKEKRSVRRFTPLLVLLGLIIVFFLILPTQYENGTAFIKDLISLPLEIKGPVSVNDKQFTTKNESSFDWEDITFSINRNGMSPGYSMNLDYLKQGETITIEITEFANNEGIRFDPKTMKPLNVTITLHDSEGRQGSSFGILEKTN